jgi:hypothetical protein
MDTQTLGILIAALVAAVVGAVVGGGTVLVVYGRAISSVLNSPVLMTSLEQLAKSWPAPTRDAVANTGKFLEEVATGTPAAPTVALNVPTAVG